MKGTLMKIFFFFFKSVQFNKIANIFKTSWYPFPEADRPQAIRIKIEPAEFLLTLGGKTAVDL